MIIYLPCRLGEKFISRKFIGYVDGKRVYAEGTEQTLKGFNAFDCQTRSLAIPTIHTDRGFLSYDHLGEFAQDFIPKYKISVDVKAEYKLSDIGFPGKRTVRLGGLKMKDGSIMADFITADRYEHLIYPIKDAISYVGINEDVPETKVEFCKIKETKDQITLFDLM